MAQNGKNAAYKQKWLKMVKTSLLHKNCSKWLKRVALVKMAQNGKNASHSSKWLKMVKTRHTHQMAQNG